MRLCVCVRTCLYLDTVLSYFVFFVSRICIAWPLYLCLYPFSTIVYRVTIRPIIDLLSLSTWELYILAVQMARTQRWNRASLPLAQRKEHFFRSKRRQPLKNSFDMTDGMISRIISDLFPSCAVELLFVFPNIRVFSRSFVSRTTTDNFVRVFDLLQIAPNFKFIVIALHRGVDAIQFSLFHICNDSFTTYLFYELEETSSLKACNANPNKVMCKQQVRDRERKQMQTIYPYFYRGDFYCSRFIAKITHQFCCILLYVLCVASMCKKQQH